MKTPSLRALLVPVCILVSASALRAEIGGGADPSVNYSPITKVAQNANGGSLLISPNRYAYTLTITMPATVPAPYSGTLTIVPSVLSDPSTGLTIPTPTQTGQGGATNPFSVNRGGVTYTVLPITVNADSTIPLGTTLYGLDQSTNSIVTISDGTTRYDLLNTVSVNPSSSLILMFQAEVPGVLAPAANTINRVVSGQTGLTVNNPASPPAISYITLNTGTFTSQSVTVKVASGGTLYGADQSNVSPFTIADTNGNQYILQTTASLSAGVATPLLFQAALLGPVSSAPGTITQLVTTGLSGVTVTNSAGPSSVGTLNPSSPGAALTVPVTAEGTATSILVTINMPMGAAAGSYGYLMTGIWPTDFAATDLGATVNATVVPPPPTVQIMTVTGPNPGTAFVSTPSPLGVTSYSVPSNPTFQVASGQSTAPISFSVAGNTPSLSLLSLTGSVLQNSTSSLTSLNSTIQSVTVTNGSGQAVTLNGTNNSSSPFTVSDGTHSYQLLATTSVGSGSALTLAFQAVQAGAVVSAPGTITTVVANGAVGVTVRNSGGPDLTGLAITGLNTANISGTSTINLYPGTYTAAFTDANFLGSPPVTASQSVTFTVAPSQIQSTARPNISLTVTDPYNSSHAVTATTGGSAAITITLPVGSTTAKPVPYAAAGTTSGGTLLNAITSLNVSLGSTNIPLYSLLNPLGLLINGLNSNSASGSGSLTDSILGLLSTNSLAPGMYTLTAQDNNSSPTQAGGTSAQATVIVTVVPSPTLVITASPAVMTYGAAVPALTVTYSGFVNGDTPASLSTLPTVRTPATSSSPVGGYTLTPSGAADANYNIVYVTGTLTVQPAPLVITAANASMSYGASALPAIAIASYSGFVNGDTAASLSTKPATSTTATIHSNAGTYPTAASGAVDANYSITYLPGTLTVSPVALTITAGSGTKVYGASLPALTPAYSGFVNGDTAASLTTAAVFSTTATASSPVSGSPYATSAAGAADANYVITYKPGTLTVTPAPLVVTASSGSMVYGSGTVPAVSASYSGFVNGDSATSLTPAATVTTTATATSGAGTYPVTAAGAVDSNYSITYKAGAITVTPVPLVITAANATMVYGSAALPALSVSYSGFVNGDTSSSLSTQPAVGTAATAKSGVGSYAITASGAADANYAISYVPGTLTVTAVPLVITANNATMTYGGPLPAFTVSYSGFINGDTAASLTTQPKVATNATASSPVGGGPYILTPSGAVDANYAITYAPGTLTITPAVLTVTANNATMTQGAALPALSVTYSGFVGGDTSASLTSAAVATTTATASSPVGTYAITAAGAADSNYIINYVPGTLTVTSGACSAPTVTTTGSFTGSTYSCQNNILWFSSSVNVSGLSAAGGVLQFGNSAVAFTANGKPVTLVVPSATITFSKTATQVTSTYAASSNTWNTTAPAGYTGNVFLTALSYAASSSFSAANATVTWSGSFLGSAQNMSVQWLWTASVLSQCSTNYNSCGVKPCDSSSYCSYHNSDSAGTCENYNYYNKGTACSNGSSGSGSSGTSLSGLFPTGVNATGSLLAAGAGDAHYTVTASSLGSKYTGNPVVDAQSLAYGWVPNTSGAQWITAPGGVNIGNGAGNNSLPATGSTSLADTYDYTTTFTMPANASLNTVTISGTLSADDTVAIYVNGTQVTSNVPKVTDNQYNAICPFTLNSSNATFQQGVNTILFRVANENTPTPTNPSGLYVQAISGSVTVPANVFPVTYCANLGGQSGQSTGQPPTVVESAPVDGATYPFAAGSSVTIPVAFSAVSPANSGNITAVSATLNSNALGLTTTTGVNSSATATGAASVTLSTAGTYTFVVTGTNAYGSATDSATITLVQVAPPTITITAPATGSTVTIPYGSSTVAVPYTFTGATTYAGIASVGVTLNGAAVSTAPSVTGLNTTSISGSGTLTLSAGSYSLAATDSNGVASATDTNSFTVVAGDCGGGSVGSTGCNNEFLVWVQQNACSGQYGYNNGCYQNSTGGSIIPIAFSLYSGSSSNNNCWGSASSRSFVTDTSVVIAVYEIYANNTSSNPTLYTYSATGPNPPYFSIANNQYLLEYPTAGGTHHYQVEVYSGGNSLQLLGCEDLYVSGSCMPSACNIGGNFSRYSVGSGTCLWFNSCVNVSGLSSHASTVWFDSAAINFTCGGRQVSLSCPSACIKFDPNCSTASTVYSNVANCWVTTCPVGYSGNVFLCAVPYTASGSISGYSSVNWTGCFRCDTASVNVNWQWSAASYSQCGSDYNSCGVKPVDSGSYCSYRNSDSAGTCENYRNYCNSNYGTNGSVGSISPSVGTSCWLDSSWNSNNGDNDGGWGGGWNW